MSVFGQWVSVGPAIGCVSSDKMYYEYSACFHCLRLSYGSVNSLFPMSALFESGPKSPFSDTRECDDKKILLTKVLYGIKANYFLGFGPAWYPEPKKLKLFWKFHNNSFFGRVRRLFGPISDLQSGRTKIKVCFSDYWEETTVQNTKVCLITPSHHRATPGQRAPAGSSRISGSKTLRRLLSATSR